MEALQVRQREQNPVIEQIGDLILASAVEWGDSYVTYAKNLPFGEDVIKIEKSKNEQFKDFINVSHFHLFVRRL
jgi:hypothetical protein